MISAQEIKFVRSLHQKKFRDHHGLFIAEGVKIVAELRSSTYQIHSVFATKEWIASNEELNPDVKEVNEKELSRISTQKSPNQVLAVVHYKTDVSNDSSNKLTLVLDGVSDPGNMGTIIRTADWFGLSNLVCSSDSVELYNPKVVAASMGSIFHLNVYKTNLEEFFKKNKGNKTVYGGFLNGDNVYDLDLVENAFLVIGNESRGISQEISNLIDQKIKIPAYGKAESMNASVAAAIFCSEFKRR